MSERKMRWPWQRRGADRGVPAATSTAWIDERAWLSWEAPRNFIAGEQSYQDALVALVGRPCESGYCRAVVVDLVREPRNPYDANAVRADVGGRTVGYLRRHLVAQLAGPLDDARVQRFAVPGVIRGGSLMADLLGCHVWLNRPLVAGMTIEVDDLDYEVSWPPRDAELAA
jgi:hypothetical protein